MFRLPIALTIFLLFTAPPPPTTPIHSEISTGGVSQDKEDEDEDEDGEVNDVLLPDARLSVRPASFDRAKDAESNDNDVLILDSEPLVQPALFNQVEVPSSWTPPMIILTEDLHGQHASVISAGRNHRQSRRSE